MDYIEDTTQKLNKVSSCFCLAKWTTVTLHLESGTAHSCHHPKVHKIPIEGLKLNPASLHNTPFKIEQRKKMIEGERPSECQYCWNIEDLKNKQVSDRIFKSTEIHSRTQYEKVVKDPYSTKINPGYVEVSFSNTCQFKCSYCSANFSSSWQEELNKFGNYPAFSGIRTDEIFAEDQNEYIKAFWQWWPDLKKDLFTFRITGGEPLLSPNTFKVMENLIENPEPNLKLAINSNLGAPQVLVDKYISLSNQLLEKNAVKHVELYTSIDAFGAKAEYIRNGLKHEQFWNNIEKLLQANERMTISIMSTFNALSVTSFIPLLEKIIEINKKYENPLRPRSLNIDISYLRNPEYQTVQALTPDFFGYVEEILQFVKNNQGKHKDDVTEFYDMHIYKVERLLEWMKLEIPEQEKRKYQREFYEFFSEHDRRRNTDFLKIFPEFGDFWNLCKSLSSK